MEQANPLVPAAAPAPVKPAGARWSIAPQAIMPAVLIVIVAFFTIVSPGHVFLGTRNLSMLAIELSITAVLALAMLLIILPGHIDLSLGSGVGLIGGAAAVLVFNYDWPPLAAMAVSTLAAIIIWWLMGNVIVRQRVPSFIITLGGLLIFRGLHWMVIQNSTVPVSRGGHANLYSRLTTYYIPPMASWVLAAGLIVMMILGAVLHYRARHAEAVSEGDHRAVGVPIFLRTFIGCQVIILFVLICNGYQGVPLPVVILGVVTAMVAFITTQTPFGRYLYAIGGSEEAAVISGIPVARVVTISFAIAGLLTAITGFLQTAYAGASTTTVGSLMELDAVAACVIGGVSLRGGRGSVTGVLLGSLIMAALLNGMTLMAYSPEAKYIIRGLVLALAVWADVKFAKKT